MELTGNISRHSWPPRWKLLQYKTISGRDCYCYQVHLANGFNIWSVAFVTIWMFPYQSLWQISQADRPMMMTIPLRMPHAPLTYSLRCLLEKNLSETLNVPKLLERQWRKVSFRYVKGRGGEFQSCSQYETYG